MEAESSSVASDILLMRWAGRGDETVGRGVEELGEGVRLLFRNADLSGVFTGRGLSTRSGVGVAVGVLVVTGELTSKLCFVGGVCLFGEFSGLRAKLLDLAGLGGEG